MKIGIIVAMDKEFAQLERLFRGREDIVLQKCGIGKVNSAIGAVEMIRDSRPDLIISSGCAGGAGVSLNVMDVVVASECTYHDAYCGDNCEYGQIMGMPARYKAPEELVAKACAISDLGAATADDGLKHRIVSGLTVSGEWFVDSKDKMRSILEKFPDAKAVDMESCSIAQTCYKYNVPFISFRVISDVPLKDTKASQYFDFWDRIANDSFEVTQRLVDAIL